jgi:polysaccharide deacetylase 2 family uncharacterized protein YibQ
MTNRNGNGGNKRVRTPITTPKPKSNNNKKPEKKESSVTTLLLVGAMAVASVMILAVAFMLFIKGPADTTEDTAKPEKKEIVVQVASKKQVLDAVYLALFTYELDKNSIKEKTEVDTDNDSEIKMLIDPAHIETVELRQTIVEKLQGLGLEVAGDTSILAANSKIKLYIDFSEPVVIEKKPKPNSIAFVIDDCGYSLYLAKRLAALPFDITMAIIPHTKYASETARTARANGKTVFLHQPMQPESYPKTKVGKGGILLETSATNIKKAIDSNVKDLGDIDGFNNHMGSALTQNSKKMQEVFKYMRPYTRTFVDSYTAKGTVAYDECKKAGFSCGMNRKFIDNEADYAYIRSKIVEGTEIARNEGSVIMIGHLREATVEALEKILPELKEAGYNLVSATELARK